MLINWFLCSQPALFCVENAYIFTVVNLILYSYCICSVDAQSYKLCSSFFSARSGACGVCSLCKKLIEDQNTKEPSVRINTCARFVHVLPRFFFTSCSFTTVSAFCSSSFVFAARTSSIRFLVIDRLILSQNLTEKNVWTDFPPLKGKNRSSRDCLFLTVRISGVTKRYRLSWLANSVPPPIWAQMRGDGGGVAGSGSSQWIT